MQFVSKRSGMSQSLAEIAEQLARGVAAVWSGAAADKQQRPAGRQYGSAVECTEQHEM